MFVCLSFTTVAELTGRFRCFLPSCQIYSSWQLLLQCFSCKVVHLFRHNRKSIRPGDDVCFLTDYTTVLLRSPWHSREKNMFSNDVFCFFFKFLRPGSGSSWPSTVRHLLCSLRKFLTRVDSLVGGHLSLSYVVSVAIAFQMYP